MLIYDKTIQYLYMKKQTAQTSFVPSVFTLRQWRVIVLKLVVVLLSNSSLNYEVLLLNRKCTSLDRYY